MSKKVLIGAAAIPIVIALVIAIPKISPGGEQTATSTTASFMRIEFTKEDVRVISFGVTERVGALRSESLVIDEKGQAFYDVKVEGEKGSQNRFKVSSQDMKRLKSLITDTGFMQIPKSEFEAKEDVEEYTRFTIKVDLDGQEKTVQWADPSVAQDFVPPLLIMLADRLGEIIQTYK